MDILSHAASGAAIASCYISFSGSKLKTKAGVLITGTIGAVMPDIDALSLSRRFGALFDLGDRGKEIYFGKLWYSHHNFFHSIVGGLLMTLLFALFVFLIYKVFKRAEKISFKDIFTKQKLLFVAFFSGFIMHLLGDMITPACVWDGVNMFWPSSDFVGGTGQIWWWNNYDIFLLLTAVIVINVSLNIAWAIKKFKIGLFSMVFTLIVFSGIFYQINNREHDFNYTGFTEIFDEYETQSLEEQKRILGEDLYEFMRKVDGKIPFNF